MLREMVILFTPYCAALQSTTADAAPDSQYQAARPASADTLGPCSLQITVGRYR